MLPRKKSQNFLEMEKKIKSYKSFEIYIIVKTKFKKLNLRNFFIIKKNIIIKNIYQK